MPGFELINSECKGTAAYFIIINGIMKTLTNARAQMGTARTIASTLSEALTVVIVSLDIKSRAPLVHVGNKERGFEILNFAQLLTNAKQIMEDATIT